MSKTTTESNGRVGRHRQGLDRAAPMRVRVTNTSGTEGVSGSWSKTGYFRYSATLRMPDGKILSKSFSIIKYGEEQALALAIAARHEFEQHKRAWQAKHPSTPRKRWPTLNAPEMYGIHRRVKDAHGWDVVIARTGKQRFGRHFRDRAYGGKAAALIAAKAYRDEVVRTHPPLAKVDLAQILHRNNTTGVPGVSRNQYKTGIFYLAKTQLSDGRKLRRYFSVNKYGEERAFELAVAERKRQLTFVTGYAAKSEGALPPG